MAAVNSYRGHRDSPSGIAAQDQAGPPRERHISALGDVRHVLRSKRYVPVRPESGYHAEFVARLTHGSLADLSADEHFERRRILSALFTRAAVAQYEADTLAVSLERVLASVGLSCGPLDLLVVCRRILLGLAARIIGVDGLADLDGERFARFNADFVVMERLARAKFIADPRPLLEPALAAQRRLIDDYIRPAHDRRAALLDGLGEQDTSGVPTDLITLALRHRDHYEQWDDEIIGREATLFLNASVGSTAGAICHTVEDVECWVADEPGRRALTTDREFLRGALAESLRRHANNVLIRTAVEPDRLPGGAEVLRGDVVIVDRAAANDQLVVEGDRDAAEGFDPFRSFGGRSPEYGFAFGGGSHTCIARSLVLGVPSTGADDTAFRHGLAVTVLAALYEHGVRLIADQRPVKYSDMARDTYLTFPVVFGEWSAMPSAGPA